MISYKVQCVGRMSVALSAEWDFHTAEGATLFRPTGYGLAEGARFNDEIHRLPTGHTTFIPKGLFRFKSHEDASRANGEFMQVFA